MQRIVQACLPAEEQGQVVLPGWMRAYASAAWQDRFFAEQNFTPLQQVGRTAVQLMLGCQNSQTILACAAWKLTVWAMSNILYHTSRLQVMLQSQHIMCLSTCSVHLAQSICQVGTDHCWKSDRRSHCAERV